MCNGLVVIYCMTQADFETHTYHKSRTHCAALGPELRPLPSPINDKWLTKMQSTRHMKSIHVRNGYDMVWVSALAIIYWVGRWMMLWGGGILLDHRLLQSISVRIVMLIVRFVLVRHHN